MQKFVETVYGKIPESELVFEEIPNTPSIDLENYLVKLFVREIDELSAPLEAVFENKAIQICIKNSKLLDDSAFSELKYVKARNSKNIILPKKLSPKLAYFIGYFLGDGGLKNIYKSYLCCQRFEYKIKIGDEFFCQVKIIKKLFNDLFGLNLPIRFERIAKGERLYYIEVSSKPIYRFLTCVVGFPLGSKVDMCYPPKIIARSNKEIKKWFLRGVFDADGDTRAVEAEFKSQSRIKIRMKSKELIFKLKRLFVEVFEVDVNGPYLESDSAYFQIEKHSSIQSLVQQKIFFHPIKRWRLNKTSKYLTARLKHRCS